MSERAAIRRVAALAGLAFAILWLATGRHIAPSGDATTTWAATEPHRTVLCVTPDHLVVAAAPSEADRAAVGLPLGSSELQQGPAWFGATHRDHTYRARLRLGPLDLPWMKNEYTAGFPEWLPHLAQRLFGAGRASIFALGLLVLLLTTTLAGRLGGIVGASLAGGFLATDVWFHVWKKVLAGPEVWLQLCAVGAAWALVRAVEGQSWRWLAAAGFAVGLGCHVKPSFAAVGLVLVLVSLPWLLRWGRRELARALALALVAATLGGAPSLAYWASRPEAGASQGRQETAIGRAKEVLRRFQGQRLPAGSSDRKDEKARKAWKAENDKRDKKDKEDKKGLKPTEALLQPVAWWARIWTRRAAADNDPSPSEVQPAWQASPLSWAGQGGLVLLLFGALAGGGLALRSGGLAGWAVVLAIASPLCIGALHPDAHHLALWLPLLALGLGAGLGPLARGRWLWVVASVAILVGVSRSADLASLDPNLRERAGRLLDRAVLESTGEMLEQRGALAPAVLEYELMSLLEASTRGRVRPFLYARATGAEGCLVRRRPAWLATVLRAHRGGHLLLAWGPGASPLAGGGNSWVDEAELREAARLEGLQVSPVETVLDHRGRWAATLWAITGD